MLLLTAALALLVLLPGCADKGDGDGVPLPKTGERDTADGEVVCGGVAPEISELTVSNGGLYDYSGVADCDDAEDCIYPSADVSLDVTDDDGDIHQYIIEIWFDDVLDGSVDTTGGFELRGSKGEPCEVTADSFSNLLAVGTGPLPYNTELEFAARITDADGLTSNIAISTGFTPNEDGTDGGR